MSDTTTTTTNDLRTIRILPQTVVDRIAAGEVVQRPAAAVKELCENALDAGADQIRVVVQAVDRFTVSDNGHGMAPGDLALACTRHATSKLQNAKDLQRITSFGFRGEALASLSMVSRVRLVSRTAATAAGYQMNYVDGKPVEEAATPTARPVGTTVTCTDLFYNVPHRRKSMRPAEEYQQVLKVVQLYALHCAARGVALHCQKQQQQSGGGGGSNKTDLNTATAVGALQRYMVECSKRKTAAVGEEEEAQKTKLKTMQDTATQQVIVQVFGSELLPHLLEHSSELYSDDVDNNEEEKKDDTTEAASSQKLIYSCKGFVTSPSYHQAASTSKKKSAILKRTNMVLFVNHRLVDGCAAIKRAVEDVYVEYSNKQKPPFMYLALQVPPDTVDVNVHPTKREVTLLHLERIAQHLAETLKASLHSAGQSFASYSVQVPPPPTAAAAAAAAAAAQAVKNPYGQNNKRKSSELSSSTAQQSQKPTIVAKKKQPKNMVRTSRLTQAGSLEPYLVSTQLSQSNSSSNQPLSMSQSAAETGAGSTTSILPNSNDSPPPQQHATDCPLSTPSPPMDLDLTQPGAFAAAAAQCNCQPRSIPAVAAEPADALTIRLPRQFVTTTTAAGRGQKLRLHKKVVPTACRYTSIQQLRQRVQKQRCPEMEKKLRAACFVGTVSHDRSLIQCGQELVLIDHGTLARELFRQLALFRFGGGAGVAKLRLEATSAAATESEDGDEITTPTSNNDNAGGIDIEVVVGSFVQMEESLQNSRCSSEQQMDDDDDGLVLPLTVSESNKLLAEQVGACLLQQADMLLDYFSIGIEADDRGKARLTGLPVLLEGYEPSPHGLALFLLRLATEVNWAEEKPCFHGVCRELGSYYAQLPATASQEDHAATVRHTIFPAVSTLLVPTKDMMAKAGSSSSSYDDCFATMTSLPQLYKVFERC